jgi:uncharacterized membrane protein YfcA
MSARHALIAVLAAINLAYIVAWIGVERARAQSAPGKGPGWLDLGAGGVINFLDTLGIGSFAIATALFKARRNVADERIPGTLNAGLALPTAAEGLIYITLVRVDPATLTGMIAAAVAGAWLGARAVSRLSRRAVQITMGAALLVAAAIYAASAAHWLPGGGQAAGLAGPLLVFACVINFILGALMSAGVGLYAPCLILLSLLGMNPVAAFPIMAGSCGCLMPVAGLQLIRAQRYDRRAALGLTLGGIPGVLLAAYVVKSLPLDWLRWLVVLVVLHASVSMLRSAAGRPAAVLPAATGPGV